ncbi:hypothetical protein IX307_002037 [Bacteroides pyogenes]|nr:hypothetical protein [Bacteroides pyogenes]MBR8709292.1 hypothetical protein [Bacteroides pyogenes]MBR8720863.1 hypothetical protein [Bacteroides pyogenes]MBR8724683.1 hypothetical protein [Bacteroides pyogenes]MBR8738229.1 hypothetical protein [Bacteroides pyogenes]
MGNTAVKDDTLLFALQQLTLFIVKVIRLPIVSHSSFVCVLFVSHSADE